MSKTQVEKIFSSLKTPAVMLSYNTDEGLPVEAKVTAYSCGDCSAEVTANRMVAPFCPSCTGDLKQSSNKVMSFVKKDFKALKPLAVCAECATSYVSDDNTLKALASVKAVNCPTCTNIMKIKADESDENEDKENDEDDDTTVTDVSDDEDNTDSEDDTNSNDTTMDDIDSDDTSDDNSDNDAEDDSETTDSSDEDETDSDLNDMMNNLSPDSSDTTSTDTETADQTSPTDSDNSQTDNTDESVKKKVDEDSDEEDENNETTAKIHAAYFQAALKKTKQFELIASNAYKNWYLFGDNSPLAVAALDNASDEIKPVFNSENYRNAFDSSVNTDGGVNTELLNDFGFTPIDVNVELDDVTKQLVDNEIAQKTEDLNNRLEDIAAHYDQCIGIAAMADLKGIYPNKSGSLRAPIIAKLKSINVRDPDTLVDSILAQVLPDYMRGIVAKATELANKTEAQLNEVADMVTSSEYRTPVTAASKPENKGNVLPFSITAETNNEIIPDNRNLNSKSKVEAFQKLGSKDLRAALSGLKGINKR